MNRYLTQALVLFAAVYFTISTTVADMIDGAAYATPITDNVQPLIYGNLFSKAYLDKSKGKRTKTTSSGSVPQNSTFPLTRATAKLLKVRYDPKVSQTVRADYIAALARSSSAKAAESIGAYYDANDVHALYKKAVSGYRLRGDDLGDVTTAYFVVMWMVANQAPLPKPKQVEAVRLQIHETLAASGSVPPDNQARQRAAESLMYQTVTLINVRETAQAQHNDAYLKQLADSAQASMAKQQFDLRGISLTDNGMVAR